jgi:hypothetical protein
LVLVIAAEQTPQPMAAAFNCLAEFNVAKRSYLG